MNDESQSRQRQWRFTQLTLFLWGWMLIAPRLQDRWLVQALLQVLLLNALLMTLRANPEWKGFRGALIGLWALALAGTVFAFAPIPAAWQSLANDIETISALPLLAMLAAGILRFVYRSQRLTVDGILASVAVYIIIALAFAQTYVLLVGWDPQSFVMPVPVGERSRHLLQTDMMYYSLITQCSVGYGDILPRSDTARMIAVTQAVVGQFYMAVVVAVFVGMYASRRRN